MPRVSELIFQMHVLALQSMNSTYRCCKPANEISSLRRTSYDQIILLSFLSYLSFSSDLCLFYFTVRLNKEPPNITFRKKEKGGINLQTTVCMNITWTGIMLHLNLQFQHILGNFVVKYFLQHWPFTMSICKILFNLYQPYM